jgi:hypothetical protein
MLTLERKRQAAEFGRGLRDPFVCPRTGNRRVEFWLGLGLMVISIAGLILVLWP